MATEEELEEEEEDELPGPEEQDEDDGGFIIGVFIWKPASGQYFTKPGQVVTAAGKIISQPGALSKLIPPDVVDAASQAICDLAKESILKITNDLKAGLISLDDWYAQMKYNIKLLHSAQSALANGGWNQMTPADWGKAGATIKKQYAALKGFAESIQSGKFGDDLSKGNLSGIANMYADSGYSTYKNVQLDNAKNELGHTEGRRLLGAADHCDDCVDYEAMGWVPIDDVPAIGDSVCLVNCRCTIETRP